MKTASNFEAALNTLSAVSVISGNKAKAQFLQGAASEELKYLLYVANCQFVVTHLSNIDLQAADPLGIIDQLGEELDWNAQFEYFKDSLIPRLCQCKSATNEIRAAVAAFICQFSPTHQEILVDVLTKRLNIGVSTKSINKIWPNLIPNPCVMLATDDFANEVQKWNITDVVLNEKFDGVRIIADFDENLNPRFFTRNFNEIDSKFLPWITSQLKDAAKEYQYIHRSPSSPHKKFFFDGELTPSEESIKREIARCEAKDEAGISGIVGNVATESRKKISGNLTRMLRGTYDGTDADFVFNCFDLVEYSGELFSPTLCDRPLSSRIRDAQKVLKGYSNVYAVESHLVSSYEDIMAIYDRLIQEGKEGVIAKLATSKYEMNRSKSWQKLKASNTIDLRIVAVEAGTPGSRNAARLGNFICQTDDGKLEVNVGSGFSDDQREEFWRDRETLIGKIVEVEYNTIINDQTGMRSLFLPRFICIRYDKTSTDTST